MNKPFKRGSTKICEICNKEFPAYTNKTKRCKGTVEKQCPVCNRTFTTTCRKNIKTCSEGCNKAYISRKTQSTMIERYGTHTSFKSKELREKAEKTNIKKYGVKNGGGSKQAQDKIKEKNRQQYGVDHFFQTHEMRNLNRQRLSSEEMQEKMKLAMISKHGSDNPMKCEEIKLKAESTNLEKYGKKCVLESDHIKAKIKDTVKKRYGVDHHMQSEIVKEKVRNTALDRYGETSVLKVESVKEKIRGTIEEKYGAQHGSEVHLKNASDWRDIASLLKGQPMNVKDLSEYFGTNQKNIRRKVYADGLENLVKNFFDFTSAEIVVKSLLDKHEIEYSPHDRSIIKPKEVDFYLPKHKIAIEVSPTWTHHYNPKGGLGGITEKNYHYNKFKSCEEKGVELITIFGWHDIDKIGKFIRSKSAKFGRIYARKCSIVIQKLKSHHKLFIEENHILGCKKIKSGSYVVEVVHDNQIMGLGVFSKIKTGVYELKRLAYKDNVQVIGGSSKILKHFIRELSPSEIITFSDNDLGAGSVYEKLNFNLEYESKGQLVWHNVRLNHKIPNLSLIKQGADRLLRSIPGYKPIGIGDNLPTNKEIMVQYGYLPVYDCGYKKWRLNTT